jgi:hypothetical protein
LRAKTMPSSAAATAVQMACVIYLEETGCGGHTV